MLASGLADANAHRGEHADGFCAACEAHPAAICDEGAAGAGLGRGHGQSVAFGCPVPATVIQTVCRSSSMAYQTRPPPVTSSCHCSQGRPLMTFVARSCLSGAWRSSTGGRGLARSNT